MGATPDPELRSFCIEVMADAIWREAIEWIPLGASTKLAAAAFDALPAGIRPGTDTAPGRS